MFQAKSIQIPIIVTIVQFTASIFYNRIYTKIQNAIIYTFKTYNTKEDMRKQQDSTHLHFYHRGQHATSLDHYKQLRLYSHIADEYNFRIGNKLMVEKIVNPRRDKTIMDSLIHASPKYILRKKKIVTKQMREAIDRRNQIAIENYKDTYKKTATYAQTYNEGQFRSKLNKNFNLGVPRCIDQTLSIRNQIPPSGQVPREVVLTKSIETRDCSLRNNFVGKIVKNEKKQSQQNQNQQFISRVAINLYEEVVQSQIIADSQYSNSVYQSSEQKYSHLKRRFMKHSNRGKYKGHIRHVSSQKSKQNKQCCQPLVANRRVLNSLF